MVLLVLGQCLQVGEFCTRMLAAKSGASAIACWIESETEPARLQFSSVGMKSAVCLRLLQEFQRVNAGNGNPTCS